MNLETYICSNDLVMIGYNYLDFPACRIARPALWGVAFYALVSCGAFSYSAFAEEPDHASAFSQRVQRPSLPDFPYGEGYRSGVTHHLNDSGIFWSVISERTHPDKRDTEGDLVALNDGSLLLAWSDFYTEAWQDDSPARISARRSADGGRTWGPIEVLQEPMGTNVMSVSLLRTSKGTVLFSFLCKNGPEGTLHYVRRSTDDGKTFGGLIPANAGHPNRVANNDRLLELHDPENKYGDRGRIVLACRDYPERAGVMVYSDDEGVTWKAGGNVPMVPEWGSQNFNEVGIIELDGGTTGNGFQADAPLAGVLWMYGRTTMGFHAQSWSADRGVSWSRPEPMILKGPCSPLTGERIPDTLYTKTKGWAGNILFTFPNHDFAKYPREYTYTARTPLDAAISDDGARTWKYIRTIEEDPRVQYGYTSITFLDDSSDGMRVLLTTHIQPIPTASHRPHDLKFISIPLKWFYEDSPVSRRGLDFSDEMRHEYWTEAIQP